MLAAISIMKSRESCHAARPPLNPAVEVLLNITKSEFHVHQLELRLYFYRSAAFVHSSIQRSRFAAIASGDKFAGSCATLDHFTNASGNFACGFTGELKRY
jgi:hypothetical protein